MNEGVDLVARIARGRTWIHDLVRLPALEMASVATVVTVALLMLLCLRALREIAIRRALAPHRRVRYLVRSTGTAERSMEEIERWAAQMSRIRRRVRRFADRPAQAVRIRLQSTPWGPAYTMEGSRRLAEPILRDPPLPVVVTRVRPRGRRRHRRRHRRSRATALRRSCT